MKKYPYHILRIGLAITFIWIGVLILKYPEAWSGYIQPWALKLMPFDIGKAMMATAIFDIAVGFFLLINTFVWVAALFAVLHLIMILVVSGITDITVRDIGLLGAALALMLEKIPENVFNKFKRNY